MAFDNEPYVINFFGSYLINSMDANSTATMGEVLIQSLYNQTKLNINGQVYGQQNIVSISPVHSPIVDPDGTESVMPTISAPLGLED